VKLLHLGTDYRESAGYTGRNYYYRLATITWSKPAVWSPQCRAFPVPAGWAGHGGVYAFIRNHRRQHGKPRIAYIGQAKSFTRRLTNNHDHFDIVERSGETSVSCGRIAFERVRSRADYYLEIEDIIKFAVWEYLENKQGFESLPGFRGANGRSMMPWVISNEGHSFSGILPKTVVYPTIAIEFKRRS
jgi:hypothetical protein